MDADPVGWGGGQESGDGDGRFEPLLTKLRGSAPDAVEQVRRGRCLPALVRLLTQSIHVQLFESANDSLHGLCWVQEVLAAANANEPPPQALENELAGEIGVKLLRWVEAVAVAFDRDPGPGSLSHQVDSIGPHLDLGRDPETVLDQCPQDASLELGLSACLDVLDCRFQRQRVASMHDQAPAEIVGLEVVLRIDGVHDPELIPGPTRGHVIALAVGVFALERERACAGTVDEGEKNDVSLVALKLGRGTPRSASAPAG